MSVSDVTFVFVFIIVSLAVGIGVYTTINDMIENDRLCAETGADLYCLSDSERMCKATCGMPYFYERESSGGFLSSSVDVECVCAPEAKP